MPTPKRILIVGGGPAASATALALLTDAGDLSLDVRLRYTQASAERPVIGETIPPAATEVLRELGIPELLDDDPHLPCPGSVSIWGDDQPGHNDFLLQPVGRAYHLDRAAFDTRLRAQATANGAHIEPGWRLRHVEEHAERHRLRFQAANTDQTLTETPDFVIDASGIGAAFTRRIGIARNVVDEVLALCALFPVGPQTLPAHTLIQAIESGWWYAARLPDERAIVSLATDNETLKTHSLNEPETWWQAFTSTGWFAEQCCRQFGPDLPMPDAIHIRPMPSAILSAVRGDNWLAVGDAASSYDAMSSAGITKALMHGLAAGRALAAHLRGDVTALASYQERVFRDFNSYLGLHQQHYRGEHRFAQAGFWRRRRLRG